jgi:endonuclease/exonuclease/phosphatase family metal-dependent hydrolase
VLDLVVVGAVRRQEVQHDAVAELGEEALRPLARVDYVVVEDEVNAARVAVLAEVTCPPSLDGCEGEPG